MHKKAVFNTIFTREIPLTSKYDHYSKDELVKIIEDRDRKPKFGLVWELWKYGYVFLAGAEKQTGLTSAADNINAIQTEMSAVCPFTMMVTIGGLIVDPKSWTVV